MGEGDPPHARSGEPADRPIQGSGGNLTDGPGHLADDADKRKRRGEDLYGELKRGGKDVGGVRRG